MNLKQISVKIVYRYHAGASPTRSCRRVSLHRGHLKFDEK